MSKENKKKRKHELKILKKLIKNLDEKRIIKPIIINGVLTDYLLSNLGEVYSLKNNKLKELKPIRLPNGYYVVTLYLNRKQYRCYIHRLVAQLFISIPEKYKDINTMKLEVNHIKGKEKWNNTEFNLEWVNSSDNKLHAYRTGLQKSGENNSHSIYTEQQIIDVCELLKANRLGPSDISIITGVSVSMIHDIKNHGSWNHITDKYDFSYCRDKQKKYSDESIELMHKLLKEGKDSCREISNKTGIKIKTIYFYRSKYYK